MARRLDMSGYAGRGVTRRALLRTAAMGTVALSGGLRTRPAWAKLAHQASGYVPRPNTTQYALAIGSASINPDGAQAVPSVVLNGGMLGPEIRVREGDRLRLLVQNRLPDSPTSIHWHGILVPAAMDGVPDVSNAPIAPGLTYVYEYPLLQSGTYWYHSHFGFQEQQGCYGAFVIEPKHETLRTEHDAVVLLSDWLHRNPREVFDQLRPTSGSAGKRGMSGGMQMGGAPGGKEIGGTPTAKEKSQPTGTMQMGAVPNATPAGAAPMKMGSGSVDLSDVKYDAFLLNGRGPGAPWALAVQRGERVRLRLINGGSSTFFRVRLDGHRLRITHADGLAVEPVDVDHLLIGMGETYDAVVQIAMAGSFTLHALAQDGSGQALGVIHTAAATPQPNRDLPRFDDGRTLTYADLRAPAATTLPEGPIRTFSLPLQGDMARYVWMIAGQVWPQSDPLRIRRGERVQIEMANETMMWHPMHLHGHFFRLLQGAGDYSPLKHTVSVAPKETVRIEFTADNPGNWFFHCHNAYHLEAGMAREFQYMAE